MPENGSTSEPDVQQVEIQVPQLRVPLAGAMLRVERAPDSDERALVVGPILVEFVLPLGGEAARNIGRELTGGIEIASGLNRAARRAIERDERKRML